MNSSRVTAWTSLELLHSNLFRFGMIQKRIYRRTESLYHHSSRKIMTKEMLAEDVMTKEITTEDILIKENRNSSRLIGVVAENQKNNREDT